MIGQLESIGGVDAAEAAVDPSALADAHARYAAERDAEIPDDHVGPRPYGGVAGTRDRGQVPACPLGVASRRRRRPGRPSGPPPNSPAQSHPALGTDPARNDPAHNVMTFRVDGESCAVSTPCGATVTLPWGPVNLTAAWLAEHDPPHPAALTNALGTVDDELDELERSDPSVLDEPEVVAGR